jgi:hypothetical protein
MKGKHTAEQQAQPCVGPPASPALRPSTPPAWPRRATWLLVPALLLLNAVLAVTSFVGDSITFDETSHLTAGYSYWRTGDFRFTPDHPPLGKLWGAFPLLFMKLQEPDWNSLSWWSKPDSFQLGREWLFQHNDGQKLLVAGRCAMVLWLTATCLLVYFLGRRLWGPAGGWLAFVIAVLSPTLLAHGRLVTTDIPITCLTALVFLTFARLAERITWLRLLAALLALTAASVAKLSWPVVLVGLGAMALVVVLRQRPLPLALRLFGRGPRGEPVPLTSRRQRVLALTAIGGAAAACVWLGVWTCFGWRYQMLAPLSPNATEEDQARYDQTHKVLLADMASTIYNADGTPQAGLYPAALRLAIAHELLPEAYLLGLGQMRANTARRWAYMLGEYSPDGFRSFFPLAFALKTPLATHLLIAAALVALLVRRARCADSPLLAGLLVFGAVFGVNLIASTYNVGHRHMLPVYPLLYVLAGAAGAWWSNRGGRALVVAAGAWLLGANLWIHPHYLSYFNELIGGPRQAYRYLADSNLDWGQDLLRLAAYARQFPAEPVKLAYFGSALPTYYLPCTALPSIHSYGFGPRAALTGGLYVVSATQMVAVYEHRARDEFWARRDVQQTYATAYQIVEAGSPNNPSPEAMERYKRAGDILRELAPERLLWRLHRRPPEARVGWSLFIWHLADADVAELLNP